MASAIQSSALSLRDLEGQLDRQISAVSLIGELPLTADILEDLRDAVSRLIKRRGLLEASQTLRDSYPCCLAVFLVIHGVFHYDQGRYWPAINELVSAAAGHSRSVESDWGNFFLTFLGQRGLATFPELERTLKYVTPILLHGGIPQYCLDDYFQLIFVRYDDVLKDVRFPMPEATLETLALIADRSAADRPVARLIKHGGAFARDLLARTIELARIVEERTSLPDPAEIGLPQRVIDRYATWKHARRHAPRERETGWRPRRPELWLDPWGEGVYLELPAQQLPHGERPTASWVLKSQGSSKKRSIASRFISPGWETSPDRLVLEPSRDRYSVTFSDGRDIEQSWSLPGLSPDQPLMVFEPESGTFLRTPAGVPARELWLLFDARVGLDILGGRKLAELPRLVGAWQGLRVEHWDLRGARHIVAGSQQVGVIPDDRNLRPKLSGHQPLYLGLDNPDLPIYSGGLPDLIIPLTGRRTATQELERWRLTISESSQPLVSAAALTNLKQYVRTAPDHLVVGLNQLVSALGVTLGVLDVIICGPLGRDSRFKIGLVPELEVQGHLALPTHSDSGAAVQSPITLRTSPYLELECTDPAVRIIAEQPGQFVLVPPGGKTEVPLALTHTLPDRKISVPFTLPTPQLSWALNDGENFWQNSVVQCPLVWIQQAADPRLMLRITPTVDLENFPRPQLWIGGGPNAPSQKLEAQGNLRHGWSFRLRDALDTIRASRSAQLAASVHLYADESTDWSETGHVKHPVLHISQDLDIRDLQLQVDEQLETWQIQLRWRSGRPLRNRFVRLWPLWQPWEEPVTHRLPDTDDNHHTWVVSHKEVPPGRYRLQIVVETDWSEPSTQRPAPKATATTDVTIGWKLPELSTPRGVLSTLIVSFNASSVRQATRALGHARLDQGTDLMQAVSVLVEDDAIYEAMLNGQWEPMKVLSQVTRQRKGLLPIGYLECRSSLHVLAQERVGALMTALQPATELLLTALHHNGWISVEALRQQTDTLDDDTRLTGLLNSLGVLVVEESDDIGTDEDVVVAPMPEHAPDVLVRDSLMMYLREIGQYPLLTRHQEYSLAQQILAGVEAEDKLHRIRVGLETRTQMELRRLVGLAAEAREKIAVANLRLVVSIARRYQNRGLDFLDLIQEGNIGLLRAIDKFDGNLGYKFSTYATWWVKQAVSRALADQSRLIRLPVHLGETLGRISASRRQLAQSLGREPTDQELAQPLSMSEEKLRELRRVAQDPVSIAIPVGEDGESTLGDFIPDPNILDADDSAANSMLKAQIATALDQLTERERRVLELRYGVSDGQPRTLEEVGRAFGVTRERVRQIEVKALRKLRHPRLGKLLKDYLDQI